MYFERIVVADLINGKVTFQLTAHSKRIIVADLIKGKFSFHLTAHSIFTQCNSR